MSSGGGPSTTNSNPAHGGPAAGGYVPPHMRKNQQSRPAGGGGPMSGGGPRPPVPWRLRPGAKFVTAGVLALGVVGTFFYTMRSVSQDDFADIDDNGNKVRERPRV